MYHNIKTIPTDFEGKYLFTHDKNMIYGGFIVKDILELLIAGYNTTKISQVLSSKYEVELDNKIIDKIISVDLEKLISPSQKKNKFRPLLTINLSPSLRIPKHISRLFESTTFYVLLGITFVLNFLIFLFPPSNYTLSAGEQVGAYVCLLLVLVFHEMGHIFSAKKYDTHVTETGIGLYFILPVFFVDLGESWKLNKHKRILINLSGIYIQSILGLFIFGLYLITGFDMLLYLNILNFSIIILNLNPFFLFDGYWVLADLLNISDLQKVSNQYIKSLGRKANTILAVKIYAILKVIVYTGLLYILIQNIYHYVTL